MPQARQPINHPANPSMIAATMIGAKINLEKEIAIIAAHRVLEIEPETNANETIIAIATPRMEDIETIFEISVALPMHVTRTGIPMICEHMKIDEIKDTTIAGPAPQTIIATIKLHSALLATVSVIYQEIALTPSENKSVIVIPNAKIDKTIRISAKLILAAIPQRS